MNTTVFIVCQQQLYICKQQGPSTCLFVLVRGRTLFYFSVYPVIFLASFFSPSNVSDLYLRTGNWPATLFFFSIMCFITTQVKTKCGPVSLAGIRLKDLYTLLYPDVSLTEWVSLPAYVRAHGPQLSLSYSVEMMMQLIQSNWMDWK